MEQGFMGAILDQTSPIQFVVNIHLPEEVIAIAQTSEAIVKRAFWVMKFPLVEILSTKNKRAGLLTARPCALAL
jgi:hypothetical protein